MAKKKSLKQLKANTQRNYASQSIAKKPAPEPVEEAEEPSEQQQPEATSSKSAELPDTERHTEADQAAVERSVLQQLAERVRPLVTKEVNRLVKMYDYERRLARSHSVFTWPKPEIQDTVLDMAREASLTEKPACRPAGVTDDKLISKALTIYSVLERFGFSKERIEQCLSAIKTLELEDALEWLVLHCPEKELLFDSANALTASVLDSDAPDDSTQASGATTPADFPSLPSGAATPSETLPSQKSKKGQNSSSVTQDPNSVSLAQEDVDAIRDRPTAAFVSAKLELFSIQRKLVSETSRNVAQLESIVSQSSKAYLFDKRDADAAVNMGRGQLDEQVRENRATARAAEAIKKEQENKELAQNDAGETSKSAPVSNSADQHKDTESHANSTESASDGPASDTEGDLFGNLLDEAPSEYIDEATNMTIKVRSMPLPKQYAGKPPKLLLEDVVRRRDKFASKPVFSLLPGGNRAKRAMVTLRWDAGTQHVYSMHEEACPDQTQAYNYVATVALFNIDTGSVARQLAPAFRDLWGELEAKKKDSDEQSYRDHLKHIKTLIDPRLGLPVSKLKNGPDKPVETDPSVRAKAHTRLQSSEAIQNDFFERQSRQSYMDMLQYRVQLPIAQYRSSIMDAIEGSQVLVLCGETGCGKSTQVPSFILEHELRQGRPVKVYCTEPRRISAISLAQRVSQELGDAINAVGTNNSLVGYNIRLEAKVAASTRLVYATTGIVLRMLEGDRAFDEVTHLIIDEVHERSIDSDFLLIILKDLIKHRRDLKVILMSATIDAERLSAYMGNAPVITVPGRTFPVEHFFLEDVIEKCKYTLAPDSPYLTLDSKKAQKRGDLERRALEEDLDENDSDSERDLSAGYSKATRQTLEALDQTQINYELLLLLLEKICIYDRRLLQEYGGAILVFMPSLEGIRKCVDMLEAHPVFGAEGFQIHPLHSTVSSENQSRVFNIPPPGVRKIVVATNIAETGVTIPDATCVIDIGKHREMRYDEKRQISRLLETHIAKSNAMQRRGRAGRVQKGICFHLFTKHRFETQMAEHPLPEMLRLSLQDLALRIKIMSLFNESIEEVFSKAFDPPSAKNVQQAIAALQEVKALTSSEEITPLGRHLVKLPIDVHLGKMLLLACLFRCLDPALTVAAALSSKSPFVTPFGRESEADTVKRSFKTSRSDFMTLHKAYSLWRDAAVAGTHQSFCRKNFMSLQNLGQIEDLRNQFYDCLIDAGFVGGKKEQFSSRARTRFLQVPPAFDTQSADAKIVMSCLAAGMYPKLLVTDNSGVFRTLTNNAAASIHPSSINFSHGKKPDFGDSRYAVYCNVIATKKLYVWETGPVDEVTVLIMCGNEVDIRYPARSLAIDRKIRVRLPSKSALALKIMRKRYMQAFEGAMREPGKAGEHLDQDSWWGVLQGLLCTEPSELEEQAKDAEKKLTVK